MWPTSLSADGGDWIIFKSLEKLGCGALLFYIFAGMAGLWIALSVLPYVLAAIAFFVVLVITVVLFILTTVLPYVLLALALALAVAGIVWLVKRVLH